MNKAIIVSQRESTADMLYCTLRSNGYSQISVISSAAQARRTLLNTPPDIVIIDTPLMGEMGTELAETAADYTNAVIILLCSRSVSEELADKLSPYNILVLSKPLDSRTISEGIRLLKADTALISNIRESEEVMRHISDIRLINKAKTMLMKYLGFTEPQAHRHLEKQAMNSRCTRRDAARKIISDLT